MEQSRQCKTYATIYTQVLVIRKAKKFHLNMGMKREDEKNQAYKTQMLLKIKLVTEHITCEVSGRDTYLQFSQSPCIKRILETLTWNGEKR